MMIFSKPKQKINVIALGGSIVYPHHLESGGLNIPFLREFRQFILKHAAHGCKFILVVGGGRAARLYQQAAREIANVDQRALDWIGIRATRINAQFIVDILQEVAHPSTIEHEPTLDETAELAAGDYSVIVVAGWSPGWSTDYVAVKCAQLFGQKDVIIDGDTPFVYEKDPKFCPDAKPIYDLTWTDYRKMVPDIWTPGMSCPVDPLAARLAQDQGITARTVKGTDLAVFQKAVEREPFEGTIIHP